MKIFLSIVLVAVFMFSACQQNKTVKIEAVKYPGMKLGFTTHNFNKTLPISLENAKKFVDFATEQGFVWIELRDPVATLTLDECKQVADYAAQKNLEIGYAINVGLLDDNFWDTFDKGLENALVFQGPKTLRDITFGSELSDTSKVSWTEDDLARIIETANNAAGKAQEKGIHFLIENAKEAFVGQDSTYFGFEDIFKSADDDLGVMLDIANPFAVANVKATPDQVESFLKNHIDRLGYIHLKSAAGGKNLPVLTDHLLDFDKVFSVMNAHNVPYLCIEIEAVDNVDQEKQNHIKSVDYLVEKGFFKR